MTTFTTISSTGGTDFSNAAEFEVVGSNSAATTSTADIVYNSMNGIGSEISSVDEDDGTVIKGKIDVLVVSEKFWVLVIESKMSNFSLTAALPQTLSYMLASPAVH